MTYWTRQDPSYVSWRIDPGITAIFTTCVGGESSPPFAGLNVSFNVGDFPLAVLENRQRVMTAIDRKLDQLVMAEQVHHNRVAWVQTSDASKGALEATTALRGIDGLLTRSQQVVLGMGFADCVPIFLAIPQVGIVGLLHAGWRGTVRGIQTQALRLLLDDGVDPYDIHVGIGPSIGPCCYEIDEPVASEFRNQYDFTAPLRPVRAGHYLLDLWEANRRKLIQAGIPEANIDVARMCTACQPEQFFSYRRDRSRTGRMGGFICMKQ